MEWPEVQGRIDGGEDNRTEFKRGLGDLGALGRTLCAFASGAGGLVVIGVDNAGAIVGVSESPETVQERLTSFLQTGCGKPVTAGRGRQDTGRGWVHWIDGHRHQRGHEPFSHDGRFWIRRGRRRPKSMSSTVAERMICSRSERARRRSAAPEAPRARRDRRPAVVLMRAQGLDTEQAPRPAPEDDLRTPASSTSWTACCGRRCTG